MISRYTAAAIGVVALHLLSGPAHAANKRTWVSAAGADQAGCGPIANPCRSLQYAHNVTEAGGEIDVKDSAGYGSLVINKAIAVVSVGSLAGVLAPIAGNAIEISAGASDAVTLQGLTVEGAGVGRNGIVFNSGSKLIISDTSVRNFVGSNSLDVGNGIYLQPSSGSPTIIIKQTTVTNNESSGISYFPVSGNAAASLLIDSVTATANGSGIVLGSYVANTVRANVSNTIASKNQYNGFLINNAQNTAFFDQCGADQNGNAGFSINAGKAVIGRSRASNNGQYGVSNGGTTTSYKNNEFSGNGFGSTTGTIGSAILE